MRPRALALAALLAAAACQSPRPPREAAEGSISGNWSASSAATGAREGEEGELRWSLAVDEGEAGRLRGTGAVRGSGEESTSFRIAGVRGENTVTIRLHLDGDEVKYMGSILNDHTMVGEMALPADTLPMTFTRR